MPHGTNLLDRMQGLSFALIAGAMLQGCTTESNAPDLTGSCLILHAERPDSLYASAVDSLETALPSRVVLTAIPAREQNSWRVEFVRGATPSIHRMRFWQRVEPDSVAIVFSTGFAGVGVRLQNRADTLRGTAETFFDYQSGVVNPAWAERIDCDAPIPPHERYAAKLTGEVPINSSSDTLRLDEVLDTSVVAVDSTWKGLEFLSARPAGIFRDATALSIVRGQGGEVERIDVWFTGAVLADRLAARLSAEWGPPQGVRMWIDRRYQIHISDRIWPAPYAHVIVHLNQAHGH